MVIGCIAILLAGVLWVVTRRENRKRDASAHTIAHIQDSEFMDLTDRQNKEFRYML